MLVQEVKLPRFSRLVPMGQQQSQWHAPRTPAATCSRATNAIGAVVEAFDEVEHLGPCSASDLEADPVEQFGLEPT